MITATDHVSAEDLAAQVLDLHHYLGMPRIAPFKVPAGLGTFEQWQLYVKPLPVHAGMLVKYIDIDPNGAGAVVIYGPEQRRPGMELFDGRQAWRLCPGGNDFSQTQIAKGSLVGSAISPRINTPPVAIHWDETSISFCSMEPPVQISNCFGLEGITSLAFRPDGRFITVRTVDNGFHGYKMYWEESRLRIVPFGKCPNRQTGGPAAMAYNSTGNKLFFVEAGTCGFCDLQQPQPVPQEMPPVPGGYRPLAVACCPYDNLPGYLVKPPLAMYVGGGPFAWFTRGGNAPWARVRIAHDGQEFGATSGGWLTGHACIARRQDQVGVFETPPSLADGGNARARRLAQAMGEEPTLLYSWAPRAGQIVKGLQVLRAEKIIIAYTCPALTS